MGLHDAIAVSRKTRKFAGANQRPSVATCAPIFSNYVIRLHDQFIGDHLRVAPLRKE